MKTCAGWIRMMWPLGSPLLTALSAIPWEILRLLHKPRRVPAFLGWCNSYTNKENVCPILLYLKSCLWAKPPHSLWGKMRIYFWYNPVPEHTPGTNAQLGWEWVPAHSPGKHLREAPRCSCIHSVAQGQPDSGGSDFTPAPASAAGPTSCCAFALWLQQNHKLLGVKYCQCILNSPSPNLLLFGQTCPFCCFAEAVL